MSELIDRIKQEFKKAQPRIWNMGKWVKYNEHRDHRDAEDEINSAWLAQSIRQFVAGWMAASGDSRLGDNGRFDRDAELREFLDAISFADWKPNKSWVWWWEFGLDLVEGDPMFGIRGDLK